MIPLFIKKRIPNVLLIYKDYIFTKAKITEKVLTNDTLRIYVFLAADYANLGDIAITYAQKQILIKKFPNSKIIEVPASCDLSVLKGYINQIRKTDIVTIVGGGNMGDMYRGYEMKRQLIVYLLRRTNKIFSFPQSVDYSNSEKGRQILKSAIFSYSNNHLLLMAREHRSFLYMKQYFKSPTIETPDIVMTLNYPKIDCKRSGIVLCLRNDQECLMDPKETQNILDLCKSHGEVKFMDTHIGNNFVSSLKYNYLFDYLKTISKYRLMITDRLHGMIFAYITGTPAIVFDNSNHKVQNCYQWIRECNYIKFLGDYSTHDVCKAIEHLSKIEPDYITLNKRQTDFINKFFDTLEWHD